MLDDLKYIHERDQQDALGVAAKQADQLEYRFTIEGGKLPTGTISNVVLGGMGGSAFPGAFTTTWPAYKVPFEIVRNYDLPAYVGPQTLFIASSYSGNTEEALSSLENAAAAGAQIVVIASGGKLVEIATQKSYSLLKQPSGLQPRHAVLYTFKAILTVLAQLPALTAESLEGLEETLMPALADSLRAATQAYLPTVPAKNNRAKQLAQELMGKSVVIYAGPKLFPAAYKWKINCNENAKNVAWCNQLPEFNHNEFLGWSSHPTEKPYAIVELRSDLEHPRITKRFEISDRLLSGQWPSPEVVQAQGATIAEQLLGVIVLGDFVSLYLAMLNGLNPTPVELIEKLKAELVK
jgi:glucose/mannose-6-phosphate isomerase